MSSSTTVRPEVAPDDGPRPQQEPRPPADRRWRRRRRMLTPYVFVSPTVALLVVLMVVPIVLVVGYSFLDEVILVDDSTVVGLVNYREILGDPVFWTATRNTLFFTVVSVVAHFTLGLAFALMLDSPLLGRVAKAVFRLVFILPWLFTVAIIAVVWRMLLNPNGVVNYALIELGITDRGIEWLASTELSLYAVTFINVWAGYPFFMMSLLAGLQGIGTDLREAGLVDGAGPWQRFRHITLPQLRPIIVAMGLLDLIWTSQQFALIWLTTGGGPINVTEMLSTYTYKLAFSNYQLSLASTSAVLVLLLSMVLGVLYVRHQTSEA